MMKKFEKAFKMPFKNTKSIGNWICDANDELCFQLIQEEYWEKNRQKIFLEILNGEKEININGTPKYNSFDGVVYFKDKPHILIRGWGYLTGSGGLNLSELEANEIQDDLAEYIVDRLTPKNRTT